MNQAGGFLMNNLEEFAEDLRSQNLAEGTIKLYLYEVQKIPRNKSQKKAYLTENCKDRNLIFAYRKYLKFQRKTGQISSEELENQLDTYKPPKRKGSIQNGKWFPREQWEDLVAKGPTRGAKMGIWLGLQFGLRLGEIIHLRVQDIDFENHYVHVQARKGWNPKHYRERSIPMTPDQEEILHKWISERPSLDHPYLIFNQRNTQVNERSFQDWCKKAHPELKPHDLRRSYAKVLYYDSKKDLKLVQLTLGHANIGTTSLYLNLEAEEIRERYIKAMS